MAKLLQMLWEYMDLTVLPFFETWSAHIFGGWQRVCWCTNEAFNQASPSKEFWENCPQKKGGHIYGKNEGGAKLRKWLYILNIAIVQSTSIFIVLSISSSVELSSIDDKFPKRWILSRSLAKSWDVRGKPILSFFCFLSFFAGLSISYVVNNLRSCVT